MLGTLVNTGAIVAGSLAGMLIHSRLSEKMTTVIFQGVGLMTLTIGISMAIKSQNLMVAVISVVLGAVLGQWIDIDRRLRELSERWQNRSRGCQTQEQTADKDANAASVPKANRFTEGFITASMLFCTGSLAILGAIEDGSGETPRLLLTKSIMDAVASIALGASFGVAVLFSAVPVLIYQGTLTLLAAFLMRYLSEGMMADLSAVGGILLMGLGINILEIKKINVTNMLPALVIVVVLSYFW